MQQANSNQKAEGQSTVEPQAAAARPWLLPLVSSLLLSFTVCVFAPLETYYVSASEFWWPVTFLLPTLLLLFVGLFAVLFGLGMLFRGTLRNLLCAGYLGVALALFLQGNYLNADYGVFNGASIDWDSFGHYGRRNALVWALVILAPMALVLIKKKLVGAVRFLCVLLTLMQVVSLAALGLTTDAPQNSRVYAFTTEDEFTLSSNQNIIVFVLDTLSATAVEKYLDEHPQSAQVLDGFTQFTNSVGVFGLTRYAMPVLLTNHVYDMQTDYDHFLANAWSESELFELLKANGYRAYVYSKPELANARAATYVQNAKQQEMAVQNTSSFARNYLRLMAFRYAPHALKKWVDVYTAALSANYMGEEKPVFDMDDDVGFIGDVLQTGISAELQEPSFRLYHLFGAHRPYRLTSQGTLREDGGSTSLAQVQDGYIYMLKAYFDQLRALDLYDSATIVITADHGESAMGYSDFLDIAPVLLIKRPGDSGPLVKNTTLVSQLDVTATIAQAAGLKGNVTIGENVYELDQSVSRELPFYFYEWTLELYPYSVTLDKQGDKCYTPILQAYSMQGVEEIRPAVYEPGTWASMTTIEFADKWMDYLSDPMSNGYDGIWLGDKYARIQLRIEQPCEGKLEVRFGVTAVHGESQRMQLRDENGILAETVLHPGDTEASFVIDAQAMQGDLLSLRLVLPDADSLPQRQMAVSVNGFTIQPTQQ